MNCGCRVTNYKGERYTCGLDMVGGSGNDFVSAVLRSPHMKHLESQSKCQARLVSDPSPSKPEASRTPSRRFHLTSRLSAPLCPFCRWFSTSFLSLCHFSLILGHSSPLDIRLFHYSSRSARHELAALSTGPSSSLAPSRRSHCPGRNAIAACPGYDSFQKLTVPLCPGECPR